MSRIERFLPSTLVSEWSSGSITTRPTPPVYPMVAFGGVITQYEDSGKTYRVHTFRGSGKFVVVSGENTVDWLIVAGGGASGTGGGGAGGMTTGTGFAASTTSGDSGSAVHTITVGAGGLNGGNNANTAGATVGGNSSALGQTTVTVSYTHLTLTTKA